MLHAHLCEYARVCNDMVPVNFLACSSTYSMHTLSVNCIKIALPSVNKDPFSDQAKAEQDKIANIATECGSKLVKAREEALARLGAYEKQSGAVAGRSSVSQLVPRSVSTFILQHWVCCRVCMHPLSWDLCP
jgi:hypothetical protein